MSEAAINGLSGAGAGIVAQLISYPLQTVNTRQQVDGGLKKKVGTVEQLLQVVKHEGWGRLYGGLTTSLVGTAASQGVYYYFYQIFRNKAQATALRRGKRGVGDGSVGMFSSLIVAALSGCVNVLITTPIWVVVTRMQTHRKKSKISQPICHSSTISDQATDGADESPPYGTTDAIKELYGEGGIFGFWRGVIPTLIMVSNPSIQYMIYETLLKKLKERRALRNKAKIEVTALEVFLFGAVAKLGATLATYPLLVVKSRLQAKQVSGDRRHHYTGTLDAIIKMTQYEGFSGFYKGMSTKIVQSVLAAAVLFMVKEEIVKGVTFLLKQNAVNRVRLKQL